MSHPPASRLNEIPIARNCAEKAFSFPFVPGLVLLPTIAALHQAPRVSFCLWIAGTALHTVLTLYVMSSWIQYAKFEIAHLNPARFIPVEGNILVRRGAIGGAA